MEIAVDNLYQHADGDFYCLLSPDILLKHPESGDWLEGVVYTGKPGTMYSTTRTRWNERFTPVAEYVGDDEDVLAMIRRSNPGNTEFDFIRVFESWSESEANITGQMLELAVCATMRKFIDAYPAIPADAAWRNKINISTEDLQQVMQNYEITRTAIPHGFTIKMEMISDLPLDVEQ